MKNFYSFFIAGILLATLFTSCDDKDDDNTEPALQLSKTACELTSDIPYIEIDVTKGAGNYTTVSSDKNIAVSEIDGSKLLIYAVGTGTANVTVTDQNKNTATVKVTINELIINPMPVAQLVFIKKGEVKILDYPVEPEAKDYVESENTDIATSKIENGKISISGIKTGETYVNLKRMIWKQYSYEVKVVDLYDLIITNKEIQMPNGEETYFHIACGNGNYTITPDEEGIVSFEQVDYAPQISGINANPKSVAVQALKKGTVELTVKDGENKTNTVRIRVI